MLWHICTTIHTIHTYRDTHTHTKSQGRVRIFLMEAVMFFKRKRMNSYGECLQNNVGVINAIEPYA